ncbi:integral membrane plasmid transfer protein [Streptomyces sp. GSL17-111]|uniref:integral membrane plasmid transfer protein n=1 Tax=Streptomyces sp. GSL17-111 TaxID=3121596 RepID=UPI0030F3802A
MTTEPTPTPAAPTPPTPAPDAAAHLRALDDVQQLFARADTKASLLLALDGALLAVVAGAAKEVPGDVAVRVTGGCAVAVLAVAAVLLLRAVRPRNTAQLTTDHLLATAHDPVRQLARLDRLTRTARRKYALIGWAVDCVLVGGALLALATVLAVL